jgi:hypothetical protein
MSNIMVSMERLYRYEAIATGSVYLVAVEEQNVMERDLGCWRQLQWWGK